MTVAQREWPAWVLIAIFASVIATNAFDYSLLVPQQSVRYERHDAIVGGTAPVSERLHAIPFVMEPIIRALSTRMPRDVAFRRAYFAFHVFALIALLASVYAYARLWFTRDQALVGALVIGSVVHLVLSQGEYWDFTPIPTESVFAPWALLEPVFLALALRAFYRGERGQLAIIVTLGVVNSGIAILLSFGGSHPSMQENIAHLPALAVDLTLFLGAAMILAIAGFRRAPLFARRAAAIGALVSIILLASGSWWDVHRIMLLYPLVTPLMLSAIFGPQRGGTTLEISS